MTQRPDYIQCIKHTHLDLKNTTWCGRNDPYAFFQNLDHAAYAIKAQTRMVPCPECLEAAREQLTQPF